MALKVNSALLVGPTPHGRFAEERRILGSYFGGFTLRETSGDISGVATGRLKTFTEQSYALRVELPQNYPDSIPRIIPDGWTPQHNPHIYTDDTICVMKSSQWQPFMSVAFLVAKSAIWLNKYEIYLDRAIWPGAEQHTHGLIYNARKIWHGL